MESIKRAALSLISPKRVQSALKAVIRISFVTDQAYHQIAQSPPACVCGKRGLPCVWENRQGRRAKPSITKTVQSALKAAIRIDFVTYQAYQQKPRSPPACVW
jgi:hypothetical protein